MKKYNVSEILKLSVSERIHLVEDVWDSIAAVPDSVPITEAQKKELDKRLKAYHKNPDTGSPWETIMKTIRKAG